MKRAIQLTGALVVQEILTGVLVYAIHQIGDSITVASAKVEVYHL
ncbi:hypothetical protein [Bacillus sp. EAC]|nr:hypothetical protein [Bacillus sp. EAC]